MSSNKQFRIQNGVDITGDLVVNNQTVIDASGNVALASITSALSGGLCITFDSTTGVISIDEAEAASGLTVNNAGSLAGQAASHYRIDIYDINGTVVN